MDFFTAVILYGLLHCLYYVAALVWGVIRIIGIIKENKH